MVEAGGAGFTVPSGVGVSPPHNGGGGVGFSVYEARSSSLGAATDYFEIARTTVPAGTVAPLTRNFTSSRSFLLALYGWRLLGSPELGTVGPDTVQDYRQLAGEGHFGLLGADALSQAFSVAPIRLVDLHRKGSLWHGGRRGKPRVPRVRTARANARSKAARSADPPALPTAPCREETPQSHRAATAPCSLGDGFPGSINHTDVGFFQRCIQSDILFHGRSP